MNLIKQCYLYFVRKRFEYGKLNNIKAKRDTITGKVYIRIWKKGEKLSGIKNEPILNLMMIWN